MADHKCQSKKRNQIISITDIFESIQTINPNSIVLQGTHILLNSVHEPGLFVLYKIRERDNYFKYQLSYNHFGSSNWINITIPENLHQFFETFAPEINNIGGRHHSLVKCAVLNEQNIIILNVPHQILLKISINFKGRNGISKVRSIQYVDAELYNRDNNDEMKLYNVVHDESEQTLYGIGLNCKTKQLHLMKYNENLNEFILSNKFNDDDDSFKFFCYSIDDDTLMHCYIIDGDKSKTRLLHVLLWHDLFNMKLLIYNLKDMKLLSKYIDIKNVPPIYSQNELQSFGGSVWDYTIRSKFKFFISPCEIVFFDLYSLTINLFCISKQAWIANINNNLLKDLDINYDLGLRFKVMVFSQNEGDKNKLCIGYTNYYEKKYKLVIPLVIKNIIMQFYIYQMIKLINNHNNRFSKNCFNAYTFSADLIYYPSFKSS